MLHMMPGMAIGEITWRSSSTLQVLCLTEGDVPSSLGTACKHCLGWSDAAEAATTAFLDAKNGQQSHAKGSLPLLVRGRKAQCSSTCEEGETALPTQGKQSVSSTP